MQNYRKTDGVSAHGLKTSGFPRHEFYEDTGDMLEILEEFSKGSDVL